jgi:hypothetical protein
LYQEVATQLRLVTVQLPEKFLGRMTAAMLPWERRYDTARLTPVRVHRAVSALLAHLGTPAKPPKPCGRSPGRLKGSLSDGAERYPALKNAALARGGGKRGVLR